MFAIALFIVSLGQYSHGELEDVQLGDAGTGVAEGGRGGGIHGQGSDFGNGVPAGGTYSYNEDRWLDEDLVCVKKKADRIMGGEWD